ncbi:hypothetical protein F5Y14DRAFT_401059 [Nemania sp. NC0429]|nr:hypothetical protein F5Y14DRAFT_401059 [Nemania sp. NC0429]
MHNAATMRSLFSLALALPLASALPVEPRDAPQFVITDLKATFPYPDGPYGVPAVDSFVNMAVTYPDPSSPTTATTTTSCRLAWPRGIDPGPTAWTPCADPALQVRLPADGWTRTTNFTVELWETLTPSGTGLDASNLLTHNPNDPDAYLLCIQMGKFNPLTCTLTGPMGQRQRQVVMPAVEESSRPA